MTWVVLLIDCSDFFEGHVRGGLAVWGLASKCTTKIIGALLNVLEDFVLVFDSDCFQDLIIVLLLSPLCHRILRYHIWSSEDLRFSDKSIGWSLSAKIEALSLQNISTLSHHGIQSGCCSLKWFLEFRIKYILSEFDRTSLHIIHDWCLITWTFHGLCSQINCLLALSDVKVGRNLSSSWNIYRSLLRCSRWPPLVFRNTESFIELMDVSTEILILIISQVILMKPLLNAPPHFLSPLFLLQFRPNIKAGIHATLDVLTGTYISIIPRSSESLHELGVSRSHSVSFSTSWWAGYVFLSFFCILLRRFLGQGWVWGAIDAVVWRKRWVKKCQKESWSFNEIKSSYWH